MGFKMFLNMQPESNVEQVLGGLVKGCVKILGRNGMSKESTIHDVVAVEA